MPCVMFYCIQTSPSPTSSVSSSSYHSCAATSLALDKLRRDGVSMWVGAQSAATSPPTTTSSSIDLTQYHNKQQQQLLRSVPPLEPYEESPSPDSHSVESSGSSTPVLFTQSPYFCDDLKRGKLDSDVVMLASMETSKEGGATSLLTTEGGNVSEENSTQNTMVNDFCKLVSDWLGWSMICSLLCDLIEGATTNC